MKRKYVLLAAVIAAAMMLASCSGNTPDGSADVENKGPDTAQTGDDRKEDQQPDSRDNIEVTLKAADHTELDFEYANSEGERVICDLAIDEDGSLYILQRDGIIHKYSGDGELLETYDLKLNDQGLTAYRLTCGGGKIYLLDGHNNAVITAVKDKIENVSVLDFSDVGMSKSFYADESGRLFMSFADLDEAYSAEVDLSGETAVIAGERQRGYLIGKGRTYLPEVVSDDDKNLVKVTIFKKGQVADEFTVAAAAADDVKRSVFGLSLYSEAGGEYYGILHTFVNETGDPDKEEYAQTPVIIDPAAGTVKTADFGLGNGDAVELTLAGVYRMSLADDSLTVKPVDSCFADICDSGEYIIEK